MDLYLPSFAREHGGGRFGTRASLSQWRRLILVGGVAMLFAGCERTESRIARARFGYCPVETERAVFLSEMKWLSLLGRGVVGFPAAAKLEPFLTFAGLRPADLHEVLALSVYGRAAFLFKVDDPGGAMSRLKNTGLHVAVLNRREIVMVTTGPGGLDDGLWFWTALDKNTLAFGQRRVVAQLIEVAEHQHPGIYEKLDRLRHLLASAVDAEFAVYTFSPPSRILPNRLTDSTPQTEVDDVKMVRSPNDLGDTNASVWGVRRSDKTALLFVFFETHSRTVARLIANLGDYASRFQTVYYLDGLAVPGRVACDQEGSLVRAYCFMDRSFADKTFGAAQTFDYLKRPFE